MGLYGGPVHNNCNLKYKIPRHIPIVLQNLSGNDARLFIHNLGEQFETEDIGCMAKKKENHISFNVKVSAKLAGVTDEDQKPVH